MNDFESFLHAAPKEGEGGEVADLLREAGARPTMPEEDFLAIKEAARSQWRETVGQETARPRRGAGPRRGLALAIAATLAFAIAGALLWRVQFVSSPAAVMSVALLDGAAWTDEGDRLVAGSVVAVGSGIETASGSSRMALRLEGGESLRLDAATKVRVVSASEIALERGALYFDSSGAERRGGVTIDTAFGAVRDIGTQFEVRIDAATEGRLRVRVREGAIALDQEGTSHSAVAGEEMRLGAGGDVVVAATAVYGEAWDWVVAAAPPFDIDGKSLEEYLVWIARETGWDIRFADRDLETLASSVLLQGSIDEHTADDALDLLGLILPGSGLEHDLDEGVLTIRSADGG